MAGPNAGLRSLDWVPQRSRDLVWLRPRGAVGGIRLSRDRRPGWVAISVNFRVSGSRPLVEFARVLRCLTPIGGGYTAS